jgi:hypothetical protein
MGQEYNEKNSVHTSSILHGGLAGLLWVIFLRKRASRETQEGRQIRPFYSAKSLKYMAEEGTT